MSGGLQFDEETSRKVEAVYQTPDVIAQYGDPYYRQQHWGALEPLAKCVNNSGYNRS